jgi:SH2 domain
MDAESESHRSTIEFDFKRNVIRETSSANCSPKKFLLSTLKRTDSLNANHHQIDDDIEDLELKEASWFHSGLPRQMSLEILAQQSPGDFIVRRSHNKNGSFTLSLRIPGASHKIAHYLIVRTQRGYKIKVRNPPTFLLSLVALFTVLYPLRAGIPQGVLVASCFNHTSLGDAGIAASATRPPAAHQRQPKVQKHRRLRYVREAQGPAIDFLRFRRQRIESLAFLEHSSPVKAGKRRKMLCKYFELLKFHKNQAPDICFLI